MCKYEEPLNVCGEDERASAKFRVIRSGRWVNIKPNVRLESCLGARAFFDRRRSHELYE